MSSSIFLFLIGNQDMIVISMGLAMTMILITIIITLCMFKMRSSLEWQTPPFGRH